MLNRLIFSVALLNTINLHAQIGDSTTTNQIPSGYIDKASSKVTGLKERLDKKSSKALVQLKKQEEKIIRKLQKVDSSKAKEIMSLSKARYEQLEAKLKIPGKLAPYVPGLDSLSTSLNFLNQNPGILTKAIEVKDKLKETISKVDELKSQLQKAEDIKKFLKERKQYLKDQLEKLGFSRELKKLNKQVYYYSQQINEYKSILNDPKKIEKKALELLSKTKIWKDFFRKNSMLASLFRLPNPDEPLNMANFAGLQTRAQVNAQIQQIIAAGGANAGQQFQENIQSAQSQLNQLKSKVLKMGGGSSDAEMPEGFKPNNQKTKSFLQRLELGTNLQTQKANNYFPATSDLGLSLGYKLNDKAVFGIGASYKLGWGRGWNNINITHQGIGIRSYADIKLKGSFWISGGYEQNYKSAFNGFDQLQNLSGWQQSGLIGISKVISVKSKLFKKTKLMLLWDFMSYEQVPRTQPLIFRIGYGFK